MIVALIHAAATLMMAGACIFIAVVHYPLFAKVGPDHFKNYEDAHQRLTTFVVGPLMLAELVTGAWLLLAPPTSLALKPMDPRALAAIILLALIWAITFFVNVPQHAKLAKAFDAKTHKALCLWHSGRTMLWFARGVLSLWIFI